MIYLDNAATTMSKPPEVIQAVCDAMTHFGGVGRGAHDAAMDAGLSVFHARQCIAELFHVDSPARVAFLPNITYALNAAIEGLFEPGMSLITTACAHNSVLRPLYRVGKRTNTAVCVVPHDEWGHVMWDEYEQIIRDARPGLVLLTHASNVTGEVYPLAEMISVAHDAGHIVIVDAAQSAGIIDIDMPKLGIDVLCFTGHKSLYGPQGTGGMACAPHITPRSFAVGGSGVKSYDEVHPTEMPTCLEAGTLNAHGIAGLAAGVRYVQDFVFDELPVDDAKDSVKLELLATGRYVFGLRELFISEFNRHYSEKFVQKFQQGLDALRSDPDNYEKYRYRGPRITLLGDDRLTTCNAGIVAFSFGHIDAALVADILASEYGIATRAGAHCAPLMHKALGTDTFGALRFSFSTFTTTEDVCHAARVLAEVMNEWDMSDIPEEYWGDPVVF